LKKTTHEIEGGRKLYLYTFGEDAASKRQRGFWNAVGEAWRTESEAVEEWLEPVTKAMNDRLGDRQRLALDLGCGGGSMKLPPKWRVVGVDPAAEMLCPGKAIQGDGMALPIQDASFDAVVSRLAVMLAPDPVQLFREVRRVLRMGGTFTFSVWADSESNRWSSAVEDVLKAELSIRDPLPSEPSAYRLASKPEVAELLTAAGLKLLFSEQVPVPFLSRKDPKDSFNFLVTFVGPIKTMFAKVSEDRKPEIRRKVEAALDEVSRNGLVWVHHAEREVVLD
jgi:SAM-dependent methyltransferase